ncbi:phage holin family protein [Flavobacterium tegetincola]|uniref:phage holin family protein n=1 Tax=Flavobacterium tegetincola TaxID=150172 RepID=UPI00047A76EB|nr:phage holin family protein [Flavobacterium tegetincola]
MSLIVRLLVTAILVTLLANFLGGVAVDSFMTSIVVAVVLALLNLFVKPILVLFTLPVTIFTFGLFLLFINAIIIMLCNELVDGFSVVNFWSALLFSILLSIGQTLVFSFSKERK